MLQRPEPARPRIAWPSPVRWLEYLLAILAGNAVYFLVLTPGLPEWLRHRPFRLDAGLVLDFAVCVFCYALWRGAARLVRQTPKRPSA